MSSLKDYFNELPEPHRSNCINSIPLSCNVRAVASCLPMAVLLLDWNCGFAPYEYYESLYHKVK